jgi:DNA-binding response OmpR family regulator/two-component sensor histidine kinase
MEQEVSDSKLHFFTDISHELRTPLTLISAPLENVLENGSLQEEDRAQLEVVRTNANRMLRMMNQILDFRKMQSNKMRLKIQKTKLGAFVSSCSSNFLRMAEDRHIQFSIKDRTEGVEFWIDRDKVDTLMFNLLSNAFKFTSEGKKIQVEVKVDNGNGVVIVSDEGCGMPKDKLSLIFERYTTLQNYSLTKQSGTGIGLSLVKEIVDLHKAAIFVDSEEGVGSVFTITFLGGKDHFDERAEVAEEELPSEESAESTFATTEQQSILIVEDNDQMREFLKNILKKRFVVLEAPNGKIGYETAVKELPNFILTDVMMPEVDGIEMTRSLRAEERTSHIPIILLTAKTDVQSKIECMRIGANDYITKPFSMDYLEARINNILEERQNWQKKYREELLKNSKFAIPETEGALQENVSPMRSADDEMMRKFVNIIEANLSNVDFSVEDAQDALKVSRWHLLSKVKSLVGLTPNEFIKETRLAHAAKLIDEGELNMTQVAYTIGMTDSRYFSRCFKQKYGVTPTEYKNRK